jgi:hypothetical protein
MVRNYAFSSSDVNKLVGITPIYLNALVQRKLYGISPSISERHGEIKVRIFSEEDVFGIALVWTLFESGLRTQTIREVLFQLVEIEDANAAADHLSRPGSAHLVIVRATNRSKGKAKPFLRVEAVLTEDLIKLVEESIEEHPTANILLVPVGPRFAEVQKRIDAMYGD